MNIIAWQPYVFTHACLHKSNVVQDVQYGFEATRTAGTLEVLTWVFQQANIKINIFSINIEVIFKEVIWLVHVGADDVMAEGTAVGLNDGLTEGFNVVDGLDVGRIVG